MFKKINKLILISSLLLSLSAPIALLSTAQAIDVLNPNSSPGACNNPDATNIPKVCSDNAPSGPNPIFGPTGIMTTVIKIISYIIGIAAVIVIIIGAFRMIVSGGDSNSINSARSSILYALVGLVVAVLAQVIVTFVLDRIG
jgi:hypothetical protein